MVDYAPGPHTILSVRQQMRLAGRVWAIFFAGLLGVTALFGLLMALDTPKGLYPGLLIWLIGLGFVVWRPRYGVYGCVFFALIGDSNMLPWYPFVKDMSSVESMFFISHSLIFSPLEVTLVVTTLAWLIPAAVRHELHVRAGRLLWPAVALAGFATLSVFYGLGTGGDLRIALWEVRAIFYIPLVLLLANNLLTRREHLTSLIWLIVLALFFEGLVGCYEYFFVMNGVLSLGDSITEHAAAVHMNFLFVLTLAVWMFRGSPLKRWVLPLLIPPVLVTYLADERRSALVALLVALVLMLIVLGHYRPKIFWLIVPALSLASLVYLAAYWNGNGALSLPARAVKSIVAPQQMNLRDQSSDRYRQLENVNVLFTIKQAPLTGTGFGQKFRILVPMPDISFFTLWQYITHNSVLWIWINMGPLGFFALLFMVGWSLVVGTDVLQRLPGGDLSALALAATLYIVMHFVFAYVDISWDPRSMVMLGVMLGLLSALDGLIGQSNSHESRPTVGPLGVTNPG